MFHLQASGAAAQALGLLQRGVVEIEPTTAEVLPLCCVGCGLCVGACPARPERSRGKQSRRVEGSKGLPGRGHYPLHGFTDQQLLAQLSSLLMPEMVVG